MKHFMIIFAKRSRKNLGFFLFQKIKRLNVIVISLSQERLLIIEIHRKRKKEDHKKFHSWVFPKYF